MMGQPIQSELLPGDSPMRFNLAAVWALLMGGLTFAAGPLSSISANPVIGALQTVLVVLLTPGLFVSAMCGFFLPGALLNAVLHFGLCWILLRLFLKSPKRREWRAGETDD